MTTTVTAKIQFRKGTTAQWTSANPTLLSGEIGYETDTGKQKIGDGATAWSALTYYHDPLLVTDHGGLTGLSDDDHSQYHNDTRGDARYSLLAHAHAGTYDPVGTAAGLIATHEAAVDPHPGYLTPAEGDANYAPISKGVANGDSHDHSGGDGGQIAYSGLSGLPTLGTAAATASTDYATAGHVHSGVYEPADATLLKQADIDDTPVDGVTTAPVSSNWAYDHAASTTAHGISSFGATLVDDADASTARSTLGLGSAATTASGDYATSGHTHAQLHDAVTIADSTSIDLTLTGQQISAAAIFGTTSGTVCQGNDSRVTGALPASAGTLTNYKETRYATTTSGNVTLDLANGNVQRFILDAARQFTMPADPGDIGQSFVLILECATYTPTWNSSPAIKWLTPDGAAPTLVTTANYVNVLTFIWDDTDTRWLGFLAGRES